MADPEAAEILGMPKTYGIWQMKLEMRLRGGKAKLKMNAQQGFCLKGQERRMIPRGLI